MAGASRVREIEPAEPDRIAGPRGYEVECGRSMLTKHAGSADKSLKCDLEGSRHRKLAAEDREMWHRLAAVDRDRRAGRI